MNCVTKLAVTTIVLVGTSQAVADMGFQLSNRNPLSALHGLPTQLSADRFLKPGEQAATLNFDVSSHFIKREVGDDELLIDGETYTTELTFEFAKTESLRFGFRVPYISHRGGVLDDAIDGWHEFTGLDDGGRSTSAQNALHFRYVKDGVTQIDQIENENGLGDIAIFGSWLSPNGTNWQLGLNGQIKLPTGKSEAFTGDGAFAVAAWFDLSTREQLGRRLHHNLAAGLSAHDKGEVLPEQQQQLVPFASYTVSWRYSETTSLKTQLYGHGGLWEDSEITAFSGSALQVAVGINWDHSATGGLEYEFALVEDALVRTGPDVGFIFTVKRRI